MSLQETRKLRYGIAEQGTWGTAIADASAFRELTCEPVNIEHDVRKYDMPAHHGSANPVDQTMAVTTKGSAGKFTIVQPFDFLATDILAYAHFQKVVEGAATAYTKTFTYYTAHPTFSSNEGKFVTFIKRLPDASTSQKVHSAICTRFKISGQRDGLIMTEHEMVSLGVPSDTSNPSGTWTPSAGASLLYFNDITAATLTHGAALTSPSNITLKSFEVEGQFEVDKIGYDATNGFQAFGMKNRSGMFKIGLLRDSTADDAIASYKVGEMVKLVITFGSVAAITVSGKIDAFEYDKDGLLAESITFKMLSTYTAGTVGEMFTFVMSNDTNRSWPTS